MVPYIHHKWGPYVLEFNVEADLIKTLLEEGNKSRKDNLDYRNELAGQIEKGVFIRARKKYGKVLIEKFYYKDYGWFVSAFSSYVATYLDGLDEYTRANNNGSWTLENLWINYQKANECTPPHKHTGDLSFVIYLQIPDEIERENDLRTHEHKNEGPGMILVDYGMEMPLSINRIAHMPRAGDAFIFPAWLIHSVYAFKSDAERISVSGNITLK